MKIAIQGHPTRGNEVIKILESLGGYNKYEFCGIRREPVYYCVNKYGIIDTFLESDLCNYKLYTLEEFEKEFPFKIGDNVQIEINNRIYLATIADIVDIGEYKVKYPSGSIGFINKKYISIYKEMNTRNITLTLDKAKEWYKKGGELKEVALQAFTEQELNPLPKSWEEFCRNYILKDDECYIHKNSVILHTCVLRGRRDIEQHRNSCPSQKSAEAHLAMIQLEQLRNCWWNGWEPIWDRSEKWCIRLWGNELSIGVTTNISRFLTFPTKEMAIEFLKCFRDLIEKARDLI